MVWLWPCFVALVAADAEVCQSSRASSLLQTSKMGPGALPHSVDSKQVLWLTGVSLASRCDHDTYLDQYEIALLSWKNSNNSAFDPYLMIHLPAGEVLPESTRNRLGRFEQIGGHVVFHTLSVIDDLKANLHSMRQTDDVEADCVAGSFLRLEIPRIVSEQNLLQAHHNKDYVLCTDSDIMWWRKVPVQEFLSGVPSQKFSVAFSGQAFKENSPVNVGVMLMDLKNYQQDMVKLLASIPSSVSGLDQAVIHQFYQHHPGQSAWSVIWNYRMFWNGRDPVAIVHYWGLKPSKGLDCFIERRNLMGCPPIEGGLIPTGQRQQFQMQALELALSEDHQLSFMKQAVLRYQKFHALIGAPA
eukprot:Skav206120  [mRNA]  locus=scaffold172:195548:196618:+ [translate_table: standard]